MSAMAVWIKGRLRVLIAADHLAVVREHGFSRAFRVECASVKVQPEPGRPRWEGVLNALNRLVAERKWSGLSMDVALSGEFVHLAFIPGLSGNISGAQMGALAQGTFERVLGDAVGAWEIRHSVLDPSTLLGAAMEKGLLDGLSSLASECGNRLDSVTPLWSCLVNHKRAALSRMSGWLVFAEPGSGVIARLEKGLWKLVRSKQLEGAQASAVRQLLEREHRLSGSAVRDVVIAGMDGLEGSPLGEEWNVTALPLDAARLSALPSDCRMAALAGL